MKPRIQARPLALELVQLGFLLPWAGKASTSVLSSSSNKARIPRRHSSTNARTSTATPSSTNTTDHHVHAESSAMAAARSAATSTPLSRQKPADSPYSTGAGTSSSVPLLRRPAHRQPTLQFPSYIHGILSAPNPPPPADLLLSLRINPRLLTLAAGKALATYAARVGDQATIRQVWQMMMEARLAPLRLAQRRINETYTKETQRSRQASPAPSGSSSSAGFTISSERLAGGVGNSVTEGGEADEEIVDIDGYFQAQAPQRDKGHRYPVKANIWALRMFPPLEFIHPKRYTTQELLRHLHFLLLQRSAPTFEEALGLLEGSVDEGNGSGVKSAYEAAAAAGGGVEGVNGNGDWSGPAHSPDREGYRKMALLNLYLAYLVKTQARSPTVSMNSEAQEQTPSELSIEPLEMVDLALKHGAKVNKQTLHLTVNALLCSAPKPERRPVSETVWSQESEQTAANMGVQPDKMDHPLHPSKSGASKTADGNPTGFSTTVPSSNSPHPSSPVSPVLSALITRTLATISHFELTHSIRPGPETYRHLALFAADHDLVEVGYQAWSGWNEAIARLKAQAIAQNGDLDKSSQRDHLSQVRGAAIGEGNGGMSVMVDGELRIRFRRIGTMKKKFKIVLDKYSERGWIVKSRVPGASSDIELELKGGPAISGARVRGYTWVGDGVGERARAGAELGVAAEHGNQAGIKGGEVTSKRETAVGASVPLAPEQLERSARSGLGPDSCSDTATTATTASVKRLTPITLPKLEKRAAYNMFFPPGLQLSYPPTSLTAPSSTQSQARPSSASPPNKPLQPPRQSLSHAWHDLQGDTTASGYNTHNTQCHQYPTDTKLRQEAGEEARAEAEAEGDVEDFDEQRQLRAIG